MGLLTVLHLGAVQGSIIMWGEPTTIAEVAKALKSSLEQIANDIKWEDVPGTDITSCGNYVFVVILCKAVI